MTASVTSADGTPLAKLARSAIAFERLGHGPPIVLVSGLLCDRQVLRPLAEQLARQFTAIIYDRRGRGASGDTAPYAVEREVEDLGALLAEVGGSAALYGHSSGAGLALHAAASGLPITRLVLHEPPYGPDDDASKRHARELAERVQVALSRERRADAVALFFAAAGLPPEQVSELSRDPWRLGLAPTMLYDFAVMGDLSRGGTIPEELARTIAIPTLVLAGGASLTYFQAAAARLAALLPNATSTLLEGQDHGAPAEIVAPAVATFCAA